MWQKQSVFHRCFFFFCIFNQGVLQNSWNFSQMSLSSDTPLVSATGSVSLLLTVCQLKSLKHCLLPFPSATDARLFLCTVKFQTLIIPPEKSSYDFNPWMPFNIASCILVRVMYRKKEPLFSLHRYLTKYEVEYCQLGELALVRLFPAFPVPLLYSDQRKPVFFVCFGKLQ